MPTLPSGTVTFLFTDIVGSTQLWERLPVLMAAAVERHGVLVSEAIAAHGGEVFKSIGDAYCAAFSHAADAVSAAVDVQHRLMTEDWRALSPSFPGISVRIAMHTGTAEERDGDYFGPPLNRVARLMAVGHGGQILLTQATEQLMLDGPPGEITLRSLGERRLKDLHRSEVIFQVQAPGLPSDFPELSTLDNHGHNLPVQLTTFVGREHELAEVAALVGGHRLVTISGPGGCGKTRLALQVAADSLERFVDGVWLVDLEPIQDAELLMPTVAKVFSLHEEPGRPILQTVIDFLENRTILLILDNCEHLADAIAHFADTLLARCAKLKVLATSRAALGVAGEAVWPLATMSVPKRVMEAHLDADRLNEVAQNEAVRLFMDRAMAVQPAFVLTEANAAKVVDICRRLEGIPLALELCAARVKVLSLDQIAERLQDRLRLLVGGSRTAAAKHQTLRATIDWSHDQLTEDEQRLFRRLSVFRGGCTLEAAEAVLADETLDTLMLLDLVGNLVDKSLIRVEERPIANRYRMLDTLREYARERLVQAGEVAAVRRRLLTWASDLAQASEMALRGPDQAEWLERLEDEHDNLRAALEWMSATKAGTASDLAGSATDLPAEVLAEASAETLELGASLWPFWQQRGYLTEGRERLDALLALAERRPAEGRHDGICQTVLARVHNGAGVFATRQGNYAAAADHLLRGLESVREALESGDGRPTGDHSPKAVEAELLVNQGTLAVEQSDFDTALRAYEAALAVWREVGDQWGIARSLNNLGLVAMNAGDAEAARGYFQEAQGLLKALGDRLRYSIAVSNLGILALRNGEYQEAHALFTAALGTQRDLGAQARVATSLNLLGLVAYYERDLDEAGRYFEESLAIRQEMGDRRGEALVLIDRARLEQAAGRPDAALATIHACLEIHEQLGKNLSLPEALEGAASVAAARGESARAARWIGAAEAMREETGLPIDADSLVEHETLLASIHTALGDPAATEAMAAGRQMEWHQALTEALAATRPAS